MKKVLLVNSVIVKSLRRSRFSLIEIETSCGRLFDVFFTDCNISGFNLHRNRRIGFQNGSAQKENEDSGFRNDETSSRDVGIPSVIVQNFRKCNLIVFVQRRVAGLFGDESFRFSQRNYFSLQLDVEVGQAHVAVNYPEIFRIFRRIQDVVSGSGTPFHPREMRQL